MKLNANWLIGPVLVLQIFAGSLIGHTQSLPIEEWRDILNKPYKKIDSGYERVFYSLRDLEKNDLLHALAQLAPGPEDSPLYNTMYWIVRCNLYTARKEVGDKEEVKIWGLKSVNESYRSQDPQLIYFACFRMGSAMYVIDELELAATYLLKAEEVYESLPNKPYFDVNVWLILGEVLFHTGDYDACISKLKKGIAASDYESKLEVVYVKDLNTIGQAYQRLGQWDSAHIYFEKSAFRAANLSKPQDNSVWTAINAAFIGRVLFEKNQLDTAKRLFEYNYEINKNAEKNMAAYSLNWLAQINLRKGNNEQALKEIRAAIKLLYVPREGSLQQLNYLREAYRTAADVFRALKNADSLYHYGLLHTRLNDSLQQVEFRSSLGILKTRLENEKINQEVSKLQEGKKAATRTRNWIIACIVLISIVTSLLLNKLRLTQIYREKIKLQEKEASEKLAREQLQLMTRNFLEKAEMVESLQRHLQQQEHSVERQNLANTLSMLTILTEEDWIQFRLSFDKLHPGFFLSLKEKVQDITVAESRMAALTRLQLSTYQIASILGISPNSVYKTKQRLRQRLKLPADASIDERILSI